MDDKDWQEKAAELKRIEQGEREKLLVEATLIMGRIQMSTYFEKLGHGASLILLKRVKESKVYKQIPGIKTWENFCESAGWSRRKFDEAIQNINVFGEEFLRIGAEIGLNTTDFRRLRQLPQDVRQEFIDGKLVNLDDKDDVRAIIEDLAVAKHNSEKEAEKERGKRLKKEEQFEEKDTKCKELEAELDNIATGNSTSEVFLRQFKKIEENIRENDRLLRYLVDNKAFQEDIVLQGKVIKGVDAMYLTYSHLNNLVRTIIDADDY